MKANEAFTEEQKRILLADLCARLPYGVKVFLEETDEVEEVFCLHLRQEAVYTQNLKSKSCTTLCPIEKIKPFLRPMSSMTKEEGVGLNRNLSELYYKLSWGTFANADYYASNVNISPREIAFIQQFMDSHFLDWRGLIPMGLALEAKEGMYNIK